MGPGGGTAARFKILDAEGRSTKVFTQHSGRGLRDRRSTTVQSIVARPGAL